MITAQATSATIVPAAIISLIGFGRAAEGWGRVCAACVWLVVLFVLFVLFVLVVLVVVFVVIGGCRKGKEGVLLGGSTERDALLLSEKNVPWSV